MDLKVLRKQESARQMQEIINMNINELVPRWRLATDKTECGRPGKMNFSQPLTGFPAGGAGSSPLGLFPKSCTCVYSGRKTQGAFSQGS